MGPRKAAARFAASLGSSPARFEVTLYGSLAATGRGHLTDEAILAVLSPVAPTEILWQPDTILPFHTNGMTFRAFDADGNLTGTRTYYSIGGGDIVEEGETRTPGESIYPLTKIQDILNGARTADGATGNTSTHTRIPTYGTTLPRYGA